MSLNVCSDGHEEIVYDGFRCPLCAKDAELQGQVRVTEELREELKSYQEESVNLGERLATVEKKLEAMEDTRA